jgi:hypothetical protein
MLISDMHPVTATERGWKRSFHIDGTTVDIAPHYRSLSEIIATFERDGFEVEVLIEPAFEEPEQLVFENAGKLAEYEDLPGTAAIYILKLQKKVRVRCCILLAAARCFNLRMRASARAPLPGETGLS